MVAMNDDAASPKQTSSSQCDAQPAAKTKVSARKRAANRANARKSTGPKTAAGKARSALNAVQHGVLAQTSLLPGEDEAELAAMAAEFEGDYAPIGPVERALVQRLVAINWRLRRLAMAEESIAWSRICDRYVHHQQRLQVYEQLQQDPALAGPEPEFESHAGQILADDLMADGKGKLQQLTTMEIRLTGQMLGVVRQMLRLRDLRNKAAREGGGRPPLPSGEGWGEGGRHARVDDQRASASSLTRPFRATSPGGRGEERPADAWERPHAEAERARARAEDLPEVRTDSASWERADGLVQGYINEAQQRAEALEAIELADADTATDQAVSEDADTAVAGDEPHAGTRSDEENVANAASQTKTGQKAVTADAARSNEPTAVGGRERDDCSRGQR